MIGIHSSNRAEALITELLLRADVRVGGDRPWDINVTDQRFFERVIRDGQLGMGEAYMDGWWDCKSVDEMSARFIRANLHDESIRDPRFIMQYLKNRLKGIGRKSLAFEVGEAHYDLGNDLFESFLDKTMSYSCGYWRDAKSLEEAQIAKLDLVCRKLDLRRGMKVLEIGCGWGGWARHAAEYYGVEVHGITVSKEQLDWARQHTDSLPLKFELMDYRDVKGSYDRVVSVAMFEAVGQSYFRIFMQKVAEVLKSDGQFLLHTIVSNQPIEAAQSRWLNTYIFPNGELPSLAQIMTAMEGLFVLEAAHHLDGDYALTLAEWDRRFVANWPKLSTKFDQRFYRMWRFYLQISQGIFKSRLCHLWQFVFTKDGIPGLDIGKIGLVYPNADLR